LLVFGLLELSTFQLLSWGLFLMMLGILLGDIVARVEADTERGRELGWGPPGEFTEDDEEITVAVKVEGVEAI
jgi:heme A synthase